MMSAHAFRRIRPRTCREDHGAVAVQEGAVMDMGMDGTRQHLAFDIAADRNIIVGRLRMGDARRILLDDRAFVEIRRNVIRRRAD